MDRKVFVSRRTILTRTGDAIRVTSGWSVGNADGHHTLWQDAELVFEDGVVLFVVTARGGLGYVTLFASSIGQTAPMFAALKLA